MSARIKQVDELLDQAYKLVRQELEKRVRAVLRQNRRAKSFCMAMGSASFNDRNGTPLFEDEAPYAKPVWDLLDEYNDTFKLTGDPMRIEASAAPVVTDW